MIVRRAAWLTLASTAAFLACGGNGGNAYAGGLVGFNDSGTGTITNSYVNTTGAISATGGNGGNGATGSGGGGGGGCLTGVGSTGGNGGRGGDGLIIATSW